VVRVLPLVRAAWRSGQHHKPCNRVWWTLPEAYNPWEATTRRV